MEERATDEVRICKCPFCDAEVECIAEMPAVCGPCSITIVTCEKCGGKFKEGTDECPECGEKV